MKREYAHSSRNSNSNIGNGSRNSNIGNGSRDSETAIKTAVANAIDAAASKLTGATTPVNLDITCGVGVKGTIGDIQVACTCEVSAALSNEAYRREAKEKAEAEATKREAKAKAEAERREAAKKEAARLLDLYSPDELAEIMSHIK